MSDLGTKELAEKIWAKDLRTLSRLISDAENQEPRVYSVLDLLYAGLGNAKVIGVTGPPGAGKSSLTACFIKYIREQNKSVAIVAVDPVSPFSGGALLGDRIRLSEHFNDSGVFIRSLSTRGKLGGLSLATRQVVDLLDAYGFDFILIETVGVGQSEIDIRTLADATLLTLVPESGDGIQVLKAGILEIADLFVVNKSDREGADRIVQDLKNVAQMSGKNEGLIFSTSTLDDKSVRNLFAATQDYLIANTNRINEKRKNKTRATVEELLSNFVLTELRDWMGKQQTDGKNPYAFALEFRNSHPKGLLSK